jgi:hypothetical protein
MRNIKRNGNVSRKLMKLHITATIGIISDMKPGWLRSSPLLVIQFEAWNNVAWNQSHGSIPVIINKG